LALFGGTTGRVDASSMESLCVVSPGMVAGESTGAGATVSVDSSFFSSALAHEKSATDVHIATKSRAGIAALNGFLSIDFDFNVAKVKRITCK